MRLAQAIEKARPDLAAEQYRRVMDSHGEQNPDLKLECLQGLLRISPGSLEVTRRVAEAASKLGKREIARTTYQKLADQMLQIGKWPEAIAALDQVVRLDPSDLPAQIALAKAYLKNNQPLSVLELWEGEESRTQNAEVAKLLAEAFVAADQPEKAELIPWRLAAQDPSRHRVRMLDEFFAELRAEHLPERITLFGIASLAPMYLALIKRLAELTDTYGSRLSGSDNLARAIVWAQDTLKKDGLDNVHTEAVMVPHWVRGAESAEIVEPARHPMAILGLGGSTATGPGGVEADVVAVDNFSDLRVHAADEIGRAHV